MNVWESGLTIAEAEINIQEKTIELVSAIQAKFRRKEICVLFKGEMADNGFVVHDDFYIPMQTVGQTSVDYSVTFKTEKERYDTLSDLGLIIDGSPVDHITFYEKNIPGKLSEYCIKEDLSVLREVHGYNVHLHSHPFGGATGASHADKTHINSHFPCSLISDDDGDIIDAYLLLTLNDGRKMTINVELSNINIESEASIHVPAEIKRIFTGNQLTAEKQLITNLPGAQQKLGTLIQESFHDEEAEYYETPEETEKRKESCLYLHND